MSLPDKDQVIARLATVQDPEIHRPLTDLDMIEDVIINEAGEVLVKVLLTTPTCPLGSRIGADIESAIQVVPGVTKVNVQLGAMSTEQRAALATKLRGGQAQKEIPFNRKNSRTKIFAVTSGKGGVGKSSITANLAASIAAMGLKVGIADLDIYGFSIPRMMGVNTPVQQVDNMIIPPVSWGVKVMSIGMFLSGNTPVVWRGPMLHRAVNQFLSDVHWDDLDVLLLDIPPGTGDVALSVASLLPQSQILVVTTPQIAASEVAQRSGAIAGQTKQKVVGVVENMSYLVTSDGNHLPIFGTGGGEEISRDLSAILNYDVPLLGKVPLEMALREGGDAGAPIAISNLDLPAAQVLRNIAQYLADLEIPNEDNGNSENAE